MNYSNATLFMDDNDIISASTIGGALSSSSSDEEWSHNDHSKANTIIRSTMAIISLISSSILIWMISHSRTRFSTTQHRILLGMSLVDILYSLSLAHFNVTAPKDNNYFVWNARGNQVGDISFVLLFSPPLFCVTYLRPNIIIVTFHTRDTKHRPHAMHRGFLLSSDQPVP